jgi:hypothetical protein
MYQTTEEMRREILLRHEQESLPRDAIVKQEIISTPQALSYHDGSKMHSHILEITFASGRFYRFTGQ